MVGQHQHLRDPMPIQRRYQKNIGFLSEEQQGQLSESKVIIVGAGGLGGTVFEILARYGVGAITIVDFDSFEETNFNRQLLSTENRIGTNKAIAAIDRGGEINPNIRVIAIDERVTNDNSSELVAGHDLVCDCLGNIGDRFIVERAAKENQIPMVHAAIAGTVGQLTTIFSDDAGLEAIYGDEAEAPRSGEEISAGTPPSSVMAIASLQAHEAISVLTNAQESLRGNLLRVDLSAWRMERIKI
jgi:molybdopterin-synthase adenylyltransferase